MRPVAARGGAFGGRSRKARNRGRSQRKSEVRGRREEGCARAHGRGTMSAASSTKRRERTERGEERRRPLPRRERLIAPSPRAIASAAVGGSFTLRCKRSPGRGPRHEGGRGRGAPRTTTSRGSGTRPPSDRSGEISRVVEWFWPYATEAGDERRQQEGPLVPRPRTARRAGAAPARAGPGGASRDRENGGRTPRGRRTQPAAQVRLNRRGREPPARRGGRGAWRCRSRSRRGRAFARGWSRGKDLRGGRDLRGGEERGEKSGASDRQDESRAPVA